MNLLRVLLRKDLLRAWRNPIAFAIHLAVPLLITALIGLAFGGASRSAGLGRIKLAIVDEDDSFLSQLLRGALNQGQGSQHLDAVFLSRTEAVQRLTENELAAAVILPRHFASDYLSGRAPVTLELIKNPAQSFHPAIVEELLAALTTALNALNRSFRPELNAWQDLLSQSSAPASRELGNLVTTTSERIDMLRTYLFPPLIGYERTQPSPATRTNAASPPRNTLGSGTLSSVFAFILPGLTAMFLLFIADNALRDVYREQRWRTFERLCTVRAATLAFVTSKTAFAMVLVACGAAILLGGGAVVFGIGWNRPFALTVLSLAYAVFASGFMALITALAGNERRADTLNTMAGMAAGLAGGCMFPKDQLPAFISQHITPWMPTHWFAETIRQLQFQTDAATWLGTAALLTATGLAATLAATALLHRRFR